MVPDDEQSRDSAQKHATFLRSVLALDSSDPHLQKFVPPSEAEAAPDAPAPEGLTDMTTRTKRLMSRLRPRRPR